jgi:two-component system sensor histidine kinase KdpD
VKASVSSLRQPDVAWTPEDVRDFLATIEDETDRLTNLVVNLLDMSRLNAHALAPALRPTDLDEVVPAAVASLGPRGRGVVLDVPEDVPAALADPALLERVLANLIDNALVHAPGAHPVRVVAWAVGDHLSVRVVDRGLGIPPSQREAVFAPFQRLGDDAPRSGAGVGLGLAVARGLTQAMGGQLVVEDTPGGGATMVVDLRVA